MSDEFSASATPLVEQFEGALADLDWSFRREEKRMRDEAGAVYRVLTLTLVRGGTRLLLDPNGFGFPGAEAGVDLYLLPPYDPVAGLYRVNGTWFIHSPFPPGPDEDDRPEDWNRTALTDESVRALAESIAQNAVPSV